jgi:hypothetical protein
MAPALRHAKAALTVLATSVLGLAASPSRAEAPNGRATPVYILTLWTDDADDQADALTQALRSRVRQASGWSLLETNQSFETLSIALKCPSKPDSTCLQRIGDQLHADHYVWGTMGKKRAPGEVTADLHLWVRGKPSTEASETYSDNLKDASDESLRAVAAKLFGKLTASSAPGVVLVRAGRSSGSVLVDGVERGSLDGGTARLEVPAGAHTFAVKVAGFDAAGQSTEVTAGSERELSFSLTPSRQAAESAEARSSSSSFPVTKLLGYSAIVGGVGFLVAGGIEGLNWINDSNASSNDRNSVPKSVTDVCTYQSPQAQDACSKSNDAKSVSTLAWVFGGVGAVLVGTGIILVTSDHGSAEPRRDASSAPRPKAAPDVQVLPEVGPRAGSLSVRVRF